jgi:hypothetical protein
VGLFLESVDNILKFVVEIIDIFDVLIFGVSYEEHLLESGIILKIRKSRHGQVLSFSLKRGKSRIRNSYSDTYYRIAYEKESSEWGKLVHFSKSMGLSSIPESWSFDQRRKILVYYCDGESFSIDLADIELVADILTLSELNIGVK